jgi:hypothetical protein
MARILRSSALNFHVTGSEDQCADDRLLLQSTPSRFANHFIIVLGRSAVIAKLCDKYLNQWRIAPMNINEPQDDLSTDDGLDVQRDIIRQSLDAIINEIGMAMRDVGLTFPVYITARALVTIATSLDPSDEQWQHAREIVCRTLEERIDCGRLQGRELACAIANAGTINAADVTAA